ncbi:MAG: hypothetical protein ABIL68_07625 [bacterium]
MIEYRVKIFHPKHRGIYPNENIYIDGLGYFSYRKIPFFINSYLQKKTVKSVSIPYGPKSLIFISALMFCKKHFPIFCFSPYDYGTIFISSVACLSTKEILNEIKRIVDGKIKIPLLFDPYGKMDSHQVQLYIKNIRSEKKYIDFFTPGVEKMPLEKHIEFLSNSFEFSSHHISRNTFLRYYNLFLNCSRFVHIALHHFVNAGRLIINDFIEEAGLNLNMVLEALIKEYMEEHSIKSKPDAINELFIDNLKIDEELFYWYMELYDARNEFLAHIDENMFGPGEHQREPDAYCYDHYECIADLILKYIKFKNANKRN